MKILESEFKAVEQAREEHLAALDRAKFTEQKLCVANQNLLKSITELALRNSFEANKKDQGL